jgi:hypothetical protein
VVAPRFLAAALVLAALAVPNPASAAEPSCTISCLKNQSTEQSACALLHGDARTECMHRASARYRMCAQACPSASSKPPPKVTALVPAKAERN